MKRRQIASQKHKNKKYHKIRPIMEVTPINRNFSNDDLVVREISVNSEKTVKVPKKRNLPLNLKKDDLILLGIIFLLFINRHDCDENSEQEDTQDSKESMFSIERFKRILQIDKLSENDILLILMVYLLM